MHSKKVVFALIGLFIFLTAIYHLFPLYFSQVPDETKVANETDYNEYAKTYLDTYESILKNSSNLTPENIDSFKFHKGYPYTYFAIASSKKGAGVQFVRINYTKVPRFSVTKLNIEDFVHSFIINNHFNPQELDEYLNQSSKLLMSDGESLKFINGAFLNGGTLVTTGNVSLIGLDSRKVLLVIQENSTVKMFDTNYIDLRYIFSKGSFILSGSIIDEYSHIIIKSSNLKSDWSKEQAKRDAIDYLLREALLGLVEQSQIKGLGYEEIDTLVSKHCSNYNTGVYKENPPKEDNFHDEIVEKCNYYDIDTAYYEELYVEKQKIYDAEHIDDEIDSFNNLSTLVGCLFLLFIVISLIIFIPNALIQKRRYNKSFKSSLKDFIVDIIPGLENIIQFISNFSTTSRPKK